VNVLILNQSFYPDVVSVAQHAGDFAADLAAAGHSVTVLASARGYDNPSVRFPARESWHGCSIRRVRGTAFGKAHKWGRLVDSVTLLLRFVWELIRLPRFDVMVAMTHPPLVAVLAAVVARVKQSRLISWIMDLNPDQAIAAGWLRADSAAAGVLSAALRFSLRASDCIVVLDRLMRDRIAAKGIAPGKIATIPPWSHDAHVRYDSTGRASFRAAHGFSGKFVVMYAGNLSIVHPVATLLDAAALLRDRSDIVFCFVGGGIGRHAVESRGLPNVVLLPYQPLNMLSATLSAADLHAIVMGDAMPGIVHPCKIYNILAVGAPFLYIGPGASHIGEIVAGLHTPGAAYHVRHGNPSAAANAIAAAAFRSQRDIPELLEAARRFSHAVLAPRLASLVSGEAPPIDSIPLPGGSLKILFAGGCHVAGYGVGEEASFAVLVERALGAFGAEVCATRVGYLKLAHRRRVLAACRAASPDVLILQFGHPELNKSLSTYLGARLGFHMPAADSDSSDSAPLSDPGSLVSSGSAFRRRSKALLDCCLGHPLVDFQHIEMLWERLLAEIAECGIARTVLLSPFACADPLVMYYRRRGGAVCAEVARRYGYEYIDLLDALPSGGRSTIAKGYYADVFHLDRRGHEVIADAIAKYLRATLFTAGAEDKLSGADAPSLLPAADLPLAQSLR
jgi:colanic acid biosynthesis glycosyl transferase WcaI